MSIPNSARMLATANGCVMYGSPDLRRWLECLSSATSYARWSSARSAFGYSSRWRLTNGSSTGRMVALR